MHVSPPVRSVTKTVSINRPPLEAHAYLADARHWPQWAIVNVLGIEPTADSDWWRMTTPHGVGELRIRADRATGLLDHDFRDPQAAWTVPARGVPNGHGAEFMMTLFQPPALSAEEFDRQADLVDTELARLKRNLEGR